jgi:hypothetical protein
MSSASAAANRVRSEPAYAWARSDNNDIAAFVLGYPRRFGSDHRRRPRDRLKHASPSSFPGATPSSPTH